MLRETTDSPSRVFWMCVFATIACSDPGFGGTADDAERFVPIPLRSAITRVQPMTGIVLWATSEHHRTDAIQLEYSYMKYNDVVGRDGSYNWDPVDRLLTEIADRGHQAILRFYDVYPGHPTTVPDFIKDLPDYRETVALSEGKPTVFPDWSHPELQQFTLDFYARLSQRYDRDPRLAFLETGFGLWAEYHIYDGPMRLGTTFPDKSFQATFARWLERWFRQTPWLISVDAADTGVSPYAEDPALLQIPFGVFDDSFLCRQHGRVNTLNWNRLGRDRWKRAPAGGEFSYATAHDQRNALAARGPYGIPFEKAAADFHITFMIGNDQPRYWGLDRIRKAGLACGYKFRILSFEASARRSRVWVSNTGVAPIYHDAYVTVDGVRATESLRLLLPGEMRRFIINAGGANPRLAITSDRLVEGQVIEYDADLESSISAPLEVGLSLR